MRVQVVLDQIDPTTVELTVADSGRAFRPRIESWCSSVSNRSTDARSMPGSGLGLAIVRQVVQRHGGTVVAEQSEAGGALIRLRLPGHPVAMEPTPRVVRQ